MSNRSSAMESSEGMSERDGGGFGGGGGGFATPEALQAHLIELRAAAAAMIQRLARGFVVRRQMAKVLAADDGYSGSAISDVDALIVKLRARLGVVPTSASRARCARRLRCVVLNGCETSNIGRSVLASLPGVAVVCWESVAEDSAARAFAVGFYACVAQHLENMERHQRLMAGWWPRLLMALLPERLALLGLGIDAAEARFLRSELDEAYASAAIAGASGHSGVHRAFEAGCYAFLSRGFRFGDPRDYLHPPNHPHTFRADLSGECHGCMPPVHGSVLLLYNDPLTGKVVERRGQDLADGFGAESMTALARVTITARKWTRKLRKRAQLTRRAQELVGPSGRISENEL